MTNVKIVTGGARGIGYAICERLGLDNGKIAVLDIDQDVGKSACAKLSEKGVDATFYQCDVSDSASVTATVAAVGEDLGAVSVLVNNAGIIRANWLENISDDDWNVVLDVNLKGTFLMCRAVVPQMRANSGGKIVNITSRAWLGSPGQVNYSAAKGGIVSLTRSLALELARFHINVNAIAPGLIDTPMVRGLDKNVRERLIQEQPTKEMGTPHDVAAAVQYLSSYEAGFITGQVLHVCGGKSVGIGF